MKALVTDLDRTLTGHDLRIDPRAVRRMAALREAGVRVVVASGRTLEYMLDARLDEVADAIVAENGAVICVPRGLHLEVREPGFKTEARIALGPLADSFTWGRVLGSGPSSLTRRATGLLHAAGVDHHVEWNAGEAMLLPLGVDKATGANVALRHMDLDLADAWAIGDGENDVSLFRAAALSAAPANAPEAVRASASTRLVSSYADAFLDFTAALIPTPEGDAPPPPRRVPVQDAHPEEEEGTRRMA